MTRYGLDLETAFFAATVLLDAAAIARVVWRGQGVERTLSWVFAILAFPAVGAVAYFLLTGPNIRRTVAKRRRAAAEMFRDRCPTSNTRTLEEPEHGLFNLAEAVSGYPATAGNRVEFISENEAAFAAIEAAIQAARRYIYAEIYIIRSDDTGTRFLDLLAKKARLGVDVRLLYDAFGSLGLKNHTLAAFREAGGRVEAFLPLNPVSNRYAAHLRNHRKLIIVDGERAFTGSMNVGDEYSGFGKHKETRLFTDTNLAISGPSVDELTAIFLEDWHFATSERLRKLPSCRETGEAVVAVLPSGPEQERNASAIAYFAMICAARSTLYIESPYFIPDDATFRAIESAALRGVDVRIMVAAHPDVPLVGPAGRSYFSALLRAGVRLFLFDRSMLHAKTVVVDERVALVGSANLDIRSFRLNFELGVLTFHETYAKELHARFLARAATGREVTQREHRGRGMNQRVLERFAKLLSPLL